MLQNYKEYQKYQKFFDFLCFAMNPNNQPLPNVKGLDWFGLFAFVCEQAIVGVGFHGLEKLKEFGVKVPRNVLLKWYAYAVRIEDRNKLLNQKCVELVEEFKNAGFDCCVLKGQGNAIMYPGVYSRTTGDVDLLIRNADRKQLFNYLRDIKNIQGSHFQHIEYEEDGVPVEIHLMPSYANNPVFHHRLQRWLEHHSDEIWTNWIDLPNGIGRITVPTIGYNLVFQLSHMQGHFFDEGVGLRQMMDYYYLLMKAKNDNGLQTTDNGELIATLKYLNLYQFAGAVMWVLHEVFGLEEDYYIAPPDEWRGKLLLDEILKGGNFGHYSGLTNHSTGTKYFLKIKRNMRFVRAYPAEALCEPLFRTWHFFWRLFHR